MPIDNISQLLYDSRNMINDINSIAATPTKPRRIWITVILTLLNPGLALIYCGNITGGTILSLMLFIVGIILVNLATAFWFLIILLSGVLIVEITFLVMFIKYTKKINSSGMPWAKNTWLWLIINVAILILLRLLPDYIPQLILLEAFKIPAGSMENTLLVGDYLMATKNMDSQNIHNGDLIVFYAPIGNRPKYIKRCVAKAGQTIEIRDKDVFVDGKFMPLPSEGKHVDPNTIPYINGDKMSGGERDNMPAQTVPDGKLFVLGDNRDNSYDSRFWGYLDQKDVIGKALYLYFSIDRET
jgi:signal peptidase I